MNYNLIEIKSKYLSSFTIIWFSDNSYIMKRKKSIPPSVYALVLYVLVILGTILSLKHFPLLSAPVFFSIIIAYLFNPMVDYFEKVTKLSRGILSGIFILMLVFVVTFFIINLFPYLVDQVQSAAQKFPGIIKKFSNSIRGFGEYLTKNFSDYLGDFDIMAKISEWFNNSLSGLSEFLLSSFSSIYGVLLLFVYLILVPLFSFYFIKDQKKIEKTFYALLPIKYRWRMKRKLLKIDRILSSFIRGQAIVILILAVLYSIGLTLIGLPFSILIGVFAGVGDIIPYFGTIVGYSISMIIGFVHFNSLEELLLITLVFVIVKGSENWFFYPKIVGREVGLHFVWVLISIIVFGQFFGFWGLLFAIPSSAVFKVFIDDLMNYYKRSDFYNK